MIVFGVIGIVAFIIGLIFLYKSYKIKIQKKQYSQAIQQQIKLKEKQCDEWHQILKNLSKELTSTQQKIISLQQEERSIRQSIDKQIIDKKNNIEQFYNNLKTTSSEAFSSYEYQLDQAYKTKQLEISTQINQLQREREQSQTQKNQVVLKLTQLKKTFDAATAARLRQQEEQQKLSFYKIQLTNQQCSDINYLLTWKSKLYDPTIVSKIIWSSYILKPTSDMCNRILGTTKPVCGIYKITNKNTGDIYIGQSVSIAQRWKSHIKCGLGIDAPSTNKLYSTMQQTGVWNFTFEVLQECSRDKLNEKERFWIDMYQSDKVGLNSKGGNK